MVVPPVASTSIGPAVSHVPKVAGLSCCGLAGDLEALAPVRAKVRTDAPIKNEAKTARFVTERFDHDLFKLLFKFFINPLGRIVVIVAGDAFMLLAPCRNHSWGCRSSLQDIQITNPSSCVATVDR